MSTGDGGKDEGGFTTLPVDLSGLALDQGSGGVDSVVLGEGDTGSEEGGEYGSEEHCVFICFWLKRE